MIKDELIEQIHELPIVNLVKWVSFEARLQRINQLADFILAREGQLRKENAELRAKIKELEAK